LNPKRRIALAEITALHHHVVEDVLNARQPRVLLLQRQDHVHANRVQPLDILRERRRAARRRITQLLQPCLDRCLARAHRALDFPARRRTPRRLARGRNTTQPVPLLKLPHDHLLTLVVVAVRRHRAGHRMDARRDQMQVGVLGVVMQDRDVLVIAQPHAIQVRRHDLTPLLAR